MLKTNIKARVEDVPRLREMAIPIFTESYKEILTPEQNEYMLEWMYSAEQLTKELDRGVQYYILQVGGRNMGYTAFEEVDTKSHKFKLHKIYLSHSAHGQGLGKFQLSEVERIAASQGGKLIELNVNRKNKAVHFYQSQGWEIVRQEDNYIGSNFYMNDHVLQKQLSVGRVAKLPKGETVFKR